MKGVLFLNKKNTKGIPFLTKWNIKEKRVGPRGAIPRKITCVDWLKSNYLKRPKNACPRGMGRIAKLRSHNLGDILHGQMLYYGTSHNDTSPVVELN